jgi:hypothetical protein
VRKPQRPYPKWLGRQAGSSSARIARLTHYAHLRAKAKALREALGKVR